MWIKDVFDPLHLAFKFRFRKVRHYLLADQTRVQPQVRKQVLFLGDSLHPQQLLLSLN